MKTTFGPYVSFDSSALRDLVKGFIPRYAVPLSTTTFSGPAQWILKPVRMIKVLKCRLTLEAKPTMIEGAFRITLYPNNFTILYMDENSTPSLA